MNPLDAFDKDLLHAVEGLFDSMALAADVVHDSGTPNVLQAAVAAMESWTATRDAYKAYKAAVAESQTRMGELYAILEEGGHGPDHLFDDVAEDDSTEFRERSSEMLDALLEE